MRTVLVLGFALVCLGSPFTAAVAQDTVLAELYGQGVHAYFAGQYQQSHDFLTTAIEQGSRDPRCFYFRGLTYSRLGRPDEAKGDYQKGAELEVSGADRVYPVAQSLQRVQGSARLEMERQRQQARLASRTRNMKATQARYEQLQRAEGQVVRDPNRAAPAKAAELVGPPPKEYSTDPFGDNAPAQEPMPAPPAATAAQPAATDLFGESTPAPATAAPAEDATSNPFADDQPAAMPAETPAAPANPAPSDPFSDSDPFQ